MRVTRTQAGVLIGAVLIALQLQGVPVLIFPLEVYLNILTALTPIGLLVIVAGSLFRH
jgi:hypothetical protein